MSEDQEFSEEDRKYKESQEAYKFVLKNRMDHYRYIRSAQSNLFDKAVITLASGAFALTITAIKLPPETSCKTILLFTAICSCFATSMVSMLFSFQTSIKEHSKELKDLEGIYINNEENDEENKSFTLLLTNLSLFCLIVGSILLLVLKIYLI